MGSCFSSSFNYRSPPSPSTAKVIALDGSLRVYTTPATASDALMGTDGVFLCSSDSLHIDAPIPAVDPAVFLEPDQIYFVLPVGMLGRPLSREGMVELAAKGSSALTVHSRILHGKKRKAEMIRVNPVSEDDAATIAHVERKRCGGGGKVELPRSKSRVGRINGTIGLQERSRISRLKTIKEVAEGA